MDMHIISMPNKTMCVMRLTCIHSILTKLVQARGTDEYFSDNNIIIISACLRSEQIGTNNNSASK